YNNNIRIPEIIAIADPGWSIGLHDQVVKEDGLTSRGTHGYDPELADMRGIFIAHGPAIKSGLVIAPFENIQIYNLMASILGVRAAANDGDLNTVKEVLRK